MIPVTNAIALMEKSHVPTRSVLIPMLNASQANTVKTVVNVERMVNVTGRGGHSFFVLFSGFEALIYFRIRKYLCLIASQLVALNQIICVFGSQLLVLSKA